MQQVVVPVRYPVSENSRATLAEAVSVAEERDASLTVLHVNLYQNGHEITRAELKRSVERTFGHLPRTRYIVRSGLLVEETILDEVAAQGADVVIIGSNQVSKWRRMVRRLVNDANIEHFLREELDCEVVTVNPKAKSSGYSTSESSGV